MVWIAHQALRLQHFHFISIKIMPTKSTSQSYGAAKVSDTDKIVIKFVWIYLTGNFPGEVFYKNYAKVLENRWDKVLRGGLRKAASVCRRNLMNRKRKKTDRCCDLDDLRQKKGRGSRSFCFLYTNLPFNLLSLIIFFRHQNNQKNWPTYLYILYVQNLCTFV